MAIPQPSNDLGQLKVAIVRVTPFEQNCTLLWDQATRHGVVIDPGGDVVRIEAAIKQVDISVDTILLTHGHIDHAGGANALRRALGVDIVGPHLADQFLLDELAATGRQFGFVAEPVTPNRWLVEGESVDIAGRAFETFHCPGHSPGSIVYFCAAQRFAIVGDVLFAGSIGRTDFSYGDHAALIDAIHRKLLPLGDDVTFVCGHGPASTFGRERQTNPFLQG